MLVTLVTIVLMIALAISPAYLSITNQLKNNEAKKAYLNQLTQKEDNLRILAAQELEYEQEINLINSYFTDKQNDEFILANIAALAELYDVKLVAVTFDDDSLGLPDSLLISVPNIIRTQTTITANGQLENLQLFLASIESFPATITINGLTYGLDEDVEDDEFYLDYPYRLVISAEYFYWGFEFFE